MDKRKYGQNVTGRGKRKVGNQSWWCKEAGTDVHDDIFDLVSQLHQNDRARMARNIRCLRLYGASEGYLLYASSYINYNKPTLAADDRIRYNICASTVDTVHSKIGKMKPRVSFLTEGGTPSTQRQAKQLSKFNLGLFYMNDMYNLHKQAFRDAAIMDIGAVKHYICDNRIVSERVLSLQLYVDPADALYGKPQRLYQVSYLTKSSAAALYPAHADEIKSSTRSIDMEQANDEFREDYVCLIEAWSLPSRRGESDGRHVIVCGGATICNDEYSYDYFPFTFMRWAEPSLGFWGQSLVDRLTPIQLEINKMLRVIQRSMHLGSAFKVFLETGSQISKSHINNDIGSLIYYVGQAPQYVAPKVIHEEYFRHLDWLIGKAYEESGVSQLSAAARKPGGLESGKAIREYNDIESERFAATSQMYEGSYLQSARICIDLAREIGDDYEVVAQSKNFIEKIRWGDVAPGDENAFIMQMFPVSMLPHEPAGRLAFVQELINSGMIPPDYALTLLDFPDLESYLSIKNAALEDLLQTLENILEGNYQPPEPFQDLQNGIPLFQSAYLRYRHEADVSEQVLEDLRLWIESADSLLKMASKGQPAPALPLNPQSAEGGQVNPQAPIETQLAGGPTPVMPQ